MHYKNGRVRTIRSVSTVLLVALALVACASMSTNPQSVAVTSYQAIQSTLTQAHTTAVALKAAGKLTQAQETQFNAIYAQATAVYKALGNALILAIETTDAAQQSQVQAQIQALTTQLMTLVTQVSAIIGGI